LICAKFGGGLINTAKQVPRDDVAASGHAIGRTARLSCSIILTGH